MEMKNTDGKIRDRRPQTFDSSQHVFESKSIFAGYDKELAMMQNLLVRGLRELEVISLVGMGGIGKTTFATRIFNDPVIMSHFDVRAKITVSQEYQLRNLYLGLLRYTCSSGEELDEKNDGELADLVQKTLKRRRYLVIVDDIWTTQAWDDISMCFPFHNNGSRILLTTRDKAIAEYASLGMPPYQMRLLTFDECWSLLYHKVFENECLTPEFEKIGKEIARKCQGLPLATLVMAGVLLKIGKSLDEWKKLVENVNLLMSTDLDQYFSRVLALSYYHLPRHLRACLLYLAIFKKSSDIPVRKLIRLWAAEGFVKIKTDENIEMVAEKCLKNLIDRSLVSVNTWSFFGKIKSCGVHDIIHGFCLQEAQNTNFFNVILEKDLQHLGLLSDMFVPSFQRRISIQPSGTHDQLSFGDDTFTEVHSILYCGSSLSTNELEFSCFKLLRVLDLISVKFNYKPISIGSLFFLRYLAFTINQPSDIPYLGYVKNLQSLIIQCLWQSDCPVYLPKEIWGMSQLRYFKSNLNYLADPPPENKYLLLEQLHTLSGLNPKCCTPSVLEGISNVKRLKIYGTKKDYSAVPFGGFQKRDFSHLHQLDSLTITAEETKVVAASVSFGLPPASAFPQNLKKLTLQATYLPWKQMRIISELPKLEALKLERYACRGKTWETIEAGFPQLKILLIDCSSLVFWKTCSDHFPCLERLVLTDCYSLVSIPQDFADIMTLQLIELDMCKWSVVNSAKQIQQEVGDNILHVYVKNPMDKEEEIEEECEEEEKEEEQEEEEEQELDGGVAKVISALTQEEQNKMMETWKSQKQELLFCRVAAQKESGTIACSPSFRDADKKVFGCEHYKRNCKVRASCCGKLFPCRFCHDKVSDHSMERNTTTEMMCMNCLKEQPVGPICTTPSCNSLSMAKYYCSSCKLFDDERKVYHCPFCNLCRLGRGLGVDYYHCMTCDCCISMSMKLVDHKCREKVLEANCPICCDFLFTSSETVRALQCGHFMHSACFQAYACTYYICPICSKSMGNMLVYFRMLDTLMASEVLPEEFRNRCQDILCNDCGKRTTAPFHRIHHKCTLCGSYNTRVITAESSANCSR